MYLGYNTNGLAHHDLFDAVELLAEVGYRGVAITIDHNALPPGAAGATAGLPSSAFCGSAALLNKPAVAHGQITRLRRLLEKLGMHSVIETGARFLLDPRAKHEPTLLSENCRRRIDFYTYAIDCAAELGSECVSLWSGVLHGPPCATAGLSSSAGQSERALLDEPAVAPGALLDEPAMAPLSRQPAMKRLVAGLGEVLAYAATKNVLIGFEPEPGMLIDSMRAFEELLLQMESGLRLTLDVGHLQCQGETPIAEVIRRWSPRLVNVHIEDMRADKHEHLMFGEGEIDFPPVVQALAESGYTGGLFVELSRHSHMGPEAARRAFAFLQPMLSKTA